MSGSLSCMLLWYFVGGALAFAGSITAYVAANGCQDVMSGSLNIKQITLAHLILLIVAGVLISICVVKLILSEFDSSDSSGDICEIMTMTVMAVGHLIAIIFAIIVIHQEGTNFLKRENNSPAKAQSGYIGMIILLVGDSMLYLPPAMQLFIKLAFMNWNSNDCCCCSIFCCCNPADYQTIRRRHTDEENGTSGYPVDAENGAPPPPYIAESSMNPSGSSGRPRPAK